MSTSILAFKEAPNQNQAQLTKPSDKAEWSFVGKLGPREYKQIYALFKGVVKNLSTRQGGWPTTDLKNFEFAKLQVYFMLFPEKAVIKMDYSNMAKPDREKLDKLLNRLGIPANFGEFLSKSRRRS